MEKYEADYLYEVWRHGGNPDNVNLDEISESYDWVWEMPKTEHLPNYPTSDEILEHFTDE